MRKTKIYRHENKLTWKKPTKCKEMKETKCWEKICNITDYDLMKLPLKIRNMIAKTQISIEQLGDKIEKTYMVKQKAKIKNEK